MPNLFQKSVEKKYLSEIKKDTLNEKYAKFQDHFGKTEIQQNIRGLKEESYQEGFVRDLFVNVLGYTLKPQPNFNFVLEQKNVNDARKADGAILLSDKIVAVIELKGTDTTDLKSVETQAFGYKNNQPDCKYVITSNFEKLRFYINNAVDYEEFNLFNLDKDRFALLWLCLAKENLLNDLPLKIKNASVLNEEKITKELYKDYTSFKHDIYRNIVELNPTFEKLLLFKKSQKLLDRFLFIFFAEDRSLLPPNSMVEIIKQWDDLIDLDAYEPLYQRFKKYFGYMNTGHKGKKHDIFAYNGGLFLPDEVLDNIKIDDELLKRHILALSKYDFESEVDVNILGHIFEHSLNELDEIQSELDGKAVEKNKTKRKKDGVFYTPKYITKYIVENTVGKLCEEKKIELEISDSVYENAKKRSRKRIQNIEDYRKWLLELTICDPACGSGAFLNMALDYLIAEHRYIDELTASYHKSPLIFSSFENHILEKNLFGVDLNEESVEIARLSLWLRTAKQDRKLSSLSSNIKCGNSLIDDPAVAGDKAFDWKKEFPEVFEKGGFSVVIGNPPYVESTHITKEEKKFYYDNFKTAENRMNLYGLFLERSLNILNDNSLYGLIIPNYWLSTDYDYLLRKKAFVENYVLSIFNTYQVFTDATVDTVLLIGQKCIPLKETTLLSIERDYKTIDDRLLAIGNNVFSFETTCKFDPSNDLKISFSNIINISTEQKLGDFFLVSLGIVPYREGMGNPVQTKEMCENRVFHSLEKVDDSYYPLLSARQIQRYCLRPNEYFIKYGNNLAEPRTLKLFTGERLLVNRILSKRNVDVVFCDYPAINNSDGFNLIPKTNIIPLKAILAIIASRFCTYYFKSTNVNLDRATFPKLNVKTLAFYPLPKLEKADTDKLERYADTMLIQTNEIQKTVQKFHRRIYENLNISKISSTLETFYENDFGTFIKELGKLKIKLSLSQQDDWEEYFVKHTNDIKNLKANIYSTNKIIDHMVYKLYGLTEEEIKIVEGV